MSKNATATAEVLPRFDAAQFRLELAGLTEDQAGPEEREAYRESGTKLCYALARFYNREKLDPINLWNRIGDAVTVACEKVDDGDLDRLVTIALDHVKASAAKVAADPDVAWLLGEITEQHESWKLGFVRYLKTHLYAVVILGRRYWEQHKEKRREEREPTV